MNHSTHPTEDYSNSRYLYSKILLDSRNLVASQKQFVTVTYYTSYAPVKTYTKEELNVKHFDVLVSQKYDQLRGLYSIPFHFDQFYTFMWRHPDVRKWRYYGYYASDEWARWRLRHDASTGQYYRVGPKFVQHGIEKKEDLVSDQYKVNPDQARQEWRNKKKFSKDQSKGRCFCKCNLTDARYRRRWERDLIRAGRWDEIYNNKDMFTDSWDCC